jgi:hypothetical protein
VKSVLLATACLKRSGEKFVTVDARGDAVAAVVWFYAENATVATDVDVSCKRDLLRQSEHEFDGAAGIGRGFGEEIKAAITDVARVAFFFGRGLAFGIAHADGERHRKTACGPAFHTVFHAFSRRNEAQAITAGGGAQWIFV